MAGHTIERSALGRVAHVGDLYDAYSDCFTGTSVLKKDPPQTASHITDNHSHNIEYVLSDTFTDKSESLNMDTELKLSLLAGLIQLDGSGKFMQDEKCSARAIRGSLIYTIHTQDQCINLFADELKDYLALDALNYNQATHVVVEVHWGARAIVTLEHGNEDNVDIKQINSTLRAKMDSLAESVQGKPNVDGIRDVDYRTAFSLHMFADYLPAGELPQTYKYTSEVLKKMPEHITASSESKGKPLTFVMLPLSELKEHLKVETIEDKVLKCIDSHSIVQFVTLFEEISVVKQHLHDLHEDMKRHQMCVTKEDMALIGGDINLVNITETQLKHDLSKLLISIRSGMDDIEQLENLRDKFKAKPISLQHFAQEDATYSKVKEKMAFVDTLIKAGVAFVGLESSLDTLLMIHHTKDIYILFYSECKKQTDPRWRDHINTLLSLATPDVGATNAFQKYSCVVAVDTDLHPDLKLDNTGRNSLCLCLYRNGRYVDKDVVKSTKAKQLTGYAVCQHLERVDIPPDKVVVLMMCCPGSAYGTCPETKIAWHCDKCNDLVEYGFDNYFYCKCRHLARGLVSMYQFRCNCPKHGEKFLSFDRKTLELKLKEQQPREECTNILILGETGVGKSTWINGIANYMTFSSLKEAAENKPMTLIGASFTVMDDHFEEKVITIGDSSNEDLQIGQSATQDPKAYIFPWQDKMVRLIDTPGIGDTRGIQQDKANFDAILRFLSEFKELHGICILLKPNNARLGVMFKFCIKELLTHLHRSCSQNIVFCFTNARNTFYKPGDTFPALKKLLSENQDVAITLSNNTIYCMDNESFRFLSMIHNGITAKEEEFQLYSTSWDRSVSETNRLLGHISNLKPHIIQDTLSLNDTRRLIVSMTKPIADISQNIQANIAVIEDKKQEIRCSKISMKKLQKKLKLPGINLVAVPLGYPRTVCTNSSCVRYLTIEETNLTSIEYFTICHSRCYLKGIKPESFPNAELQRCRAMNGTSTCIVCGCSWDKHMHITYDQKVETCEVLDTSVDAQIKSKMTAREKVEAFIQQMIVRQDSLQAEQNTIRNACVKFGTFLAQNAMLPYNDALADYLDMLIKQEKDKCKAGGDSKTLEGLQKMLQEYLEEVQTLQESMASGHGSKLLSTHEIKRMVEELYKLPIKGGELKQHVQVATTAKSRMFSYNQTHYNPPQKIIKSKQPIFYVAKDFWDRVVLNGLFSNRW